MNELRLQLGVFIFLVICSCGKPVNKEQEIKEIKNSIQNAATAWSNGDIEGFMKIYWKSEELQFIGKKGIMYGYTTVLENYRRNFPSKEAMGVLALKVISVNFLAENLYSVTGRYSLKREKGKSDGIYTLVFKKIDDSWVVVSDHTQ